MKNRNQLKKLLILLCAVLSAGVLVSGAMAASHMEATGACTNLKNEGVEFFVPFGASLGEADRWRGDLSTFFQRDSDGLKGGDVIAMELEMANSSTRYQCTEVNPGDFSCNSLPLNGSITGVYFRVKSLTVTEDMDVRFWVYPYGYTLDQAKSEGKIMMESWGAMKYPPYPCARNYLFPKDFVAKDGEKLVINTSDCDKSGAAGPDDTTDEHISVEFLESGDQFAMVNVIPTDVIKKDRINVKVTPQVTYSYKLRLYFAKYKDTATPGTYYVDYEYDETKPNDPKITPSWTTDIPESDLPLTLVAGKLYSVSTKKTNAWGNKDYPTSTDFDIKLWYENTEGTLGYENAVFHFNRKLNIQFAPYCTNATTSKMPLTGIASSIYDVCKETRQGFSASLLDSSGKGVKLDTSKIPWFANQEHEPTGGEVPAYYFVTRKCADASCASTVETSAYPHSITVSDGDHLARTYGNAGAIYHKPGTATVFKLRPYGAGTHEFRITGTTLVVDEPGTYVIYAFLPDAEASRTTLVIDTTKIAGYYYITVPTNDSILSCFTLANNGYFKADWNDCLDPTLTQLIPFEHIQGTEEAWVRNTSGFGVHFPYVSEWSHTPQELTVASLTCKFEALSAAGRPGDGYCNPGDVYVPPYTKVTITGGSLYLSSAPKYDDYFVAYARRDTWNISHLFFSIRVKECANVKKIPDTGISLRSPLKVNESVDAATSYVFTGNSLRIPAIGLGMETPIPIVHVYYADGSADNGWDLSTLGNYVGELEGGTYLPYAGNSALTGHYYSMGVFKNLEGLNMGDEIIVYGNDGVKYIYKVVQKFIAQPTDVYEMFQQVGERSLTLVTCENYNIVTDEYERRTIVRAVIDSQDIYEEGVW